MNVQTQVAIENPYVGPRPFTREERRRFYGRERETDDLLSLVIAQFNEGCPYFFFRPEKVSDCICKMLHLIDLRPKKTNADILSGRGSVLFRPYPERKTGFAEFRKPVAHGVEMQDDVVFWIVAETALLECRQRYDDMT